ncbi:molybdopterin-dependent oxidoreductase [Streptomyces sp. NRRL F-5123]|uniref:molybdopterin-dependent oxidoreductase n=1 Tax=Streptomyces sp. NRRL F-5123 TaxID=1463856 RepID=UPI0004E15797|nr:molybdopterin-dependent oxidoreductase [Streptomyces sp. NRRL F-5123]
MRTTTGNPPPRTRTPLPAFTGRLHDPRTATAIGRWLGGALLVCFVTGLASHFLQHPPGRLFGRFPTRPVWGYRLTQGLHVAAGLAAIPLLLAKLWTVYPRLFAWPPVRSVPHALERLAVAVLVAGAMLEVFSGLLNIVQWYPWPFSFVPVHYAVAYVLAGALLLHLAAKAPQIAAHWTRRSAGTRALPDEERDGPDRRALLAGLGVAVGAVTVTTAGQTFTPLAPLDLLAPRHPGHGPQRLPVNKTAAAAGVTAADMTDWHLDVTGGATALRLALHELAAFPQSAARLPIACVEGWSVNAHWEGVRLRDLLHRAGAPPGSAVRVVSLQRHGAYRVMDMGPEYAWDPLTLLALRLNGAPLAPDHGYPARIIAPNRPGVLQTKWVARMEIR